MCVAASLLLVGLGALLTFVWSVRVVGVGHTTVGIILMAIGVSGLGTVCVLTRRTDDTSDEVEESRDLP